MLKKQQPKTNIEMHNTEIPNWFLTMFKSNTVMVR